jgi:LuxR family maltose regulon positive regulatory protein
MMGIMPGPLISTKLHIPPAPPDLVSRPHLIRTLDAAWERQQRLILISAPAGFGKTTLVAEWLRHTGKSAAWLSLDGDDNDPARFWRYVVAAMQTADAGLGRGLQGAFETQTLPPRNTLVASLINDLDGAARPLLLVLDDYHLIKTEAIHSGLNALLDRLPAMLRIVVTTRADPPLALARLRSRGQVTEARTADLRFTREEAAAFLNRVHRLDLPEEDISCLEDRTEGWIVGLQPAAHSLHRQSDRHAFVTAFAGDDRCIVDYLLQEVLDQQPPSVRSFLLKTSILDRLCGTLCEAVTGQPDSKAMIRQLEESNLFLLPLDNRRYWYRYHMLFADLLRRRLTGTFRPSSGSACTAAPLNGSNGKACRPKPFPTPWRRPITRMPPGFWNGMHWPSSSEANRPSCGGG